MSEPTDLMTGPEIHFKLLIEDMKACEERGVKWKPKTGQGIRWAADRIEELEAKVSECKGTMQILMDNNEAFVKKLGEEIDESRAQLARECVWKPHDNWEEQYWSSSCGEDWAFTEGDPEENRVNFCQGCGGKVVIALNR